MPDLQFALDDQCAGLSASGNMRPRQHRRPGSLLPRHRMPDAELSHTSPLSCQSRMYSLLLRVGEHLCSPSKTMGSLSTVAGK